MPGAGPMNDTGDTLHDGYARQRTQHEAEVISLFSFSAYRNRTLDEIRNDVSKSGPRADRTEPLTTISLASERHDSTVEIGASQTEADLPARIAGRAVAWPAFHRS